MKLEEIVKKYGKVDYYEPQTGYTYHITDAYETIDGDMKVPVSCVSNMNGPNQIIGYAHMEKVQ